MRAMLPVVLLLSFCLLAYADSDYTGAIAGTKERVVIGLGNSTGLFELNGSCSVTVLSGLVTLINKSSMSKLGGGFYYYDWDVPNDPGVYGIFFNCTTLALENYSDGGSVYVVKRSADKSMAVALAKYGPKYVEQYQTKWWDDWRNVAGGLAIIVLLIAFGMYIYDNFGVRL